MQDVNHIGLHMGVFSGPVDLLAQVSNSHLISLLQYA
jgi:hypothetical protein